MKLKNSLMLGALPLLFSSLALASASLTLQQEIVPQVLNGEAIEPSHFKAKNTLALKEGDNQLALTVGQIVFEDGKRRKFDSQPLLLNFDAQQGQSLSVHYKTFRTIDDAKKFERSPALTLTTSDGEAVDFELVQMNKGGLQGFRDYEREVADYNAKAGNDVTGQPKMMLAKSSIGSVAALQNGFSDLDAEQQQEFMQWAMRNLK